MNIGAPGNQRPEALLAYAERLIKTAIADGTIVPGSRLSPTALAVEFGISHIPVREALTSLAAMGYIEHRHRVGFFARALSSEDLADIYHWRELLESEAYRMAVPQITDEDLATMRRLAEAMTAKTSANDRIEFIHLNREFHFVAFQRAGSERLMRFLTYLWDVAEPYMIAELTESTRASDDHFVMLPLFADRDVEGVIAAAKRHRQIRVAHIAQLEAKRQNGR